MLGWNESGSLKVNPSLKVQIYEHFLNPPNFFKKNYAYLVKKSSCSH